MPRGFSGSGYYRRGDRKHTDSLTSTEGVRLLPPPDESSDQDGGRKKASELAARRGSVLQARLESLKPTKSAEVDLKHPIARRRWFDAFDHVCQQLNEVRFPIAQYHEN